MGHTDDGRAGSDASAEAVRAAARLDEVELATYADRWPVPDTRAERRARRHILGWLGLSVVAGLAFVGVYAFWPWRYEGPLSGGHRWAVWFTPMLGVTFGLTLLGLSFGVVVYAKRFLPREVAIQQRHDKPSSEPERRSAAVVLEDARQRAGLTRRSWMGRAVTASVGVTGLTAASVAIGGLANDPWRQSSGSKSLWHTAWLPVRGETVYLRMDTGEPHRVVLTTPADVAAGSFVTVVPFRESERDDPEALAAGLDSADSSAMLFHLRSDVAVIPRPGQESFNYGRFYAYSKICTHLGCPVALYESEANRLLCPCHQSQFDLTGGAKPVFGPAVRSLPQLPITVDALGDFPEPVGPAFWELRS